MYRTKRNPADPFPLDAMRRHVRTGRMATGHLTIDLSAVARNWRALDAHTTCETAAVVKADGYGLGAGRIAATLARVGARRFFVATAQEGPAVRMAVGADAEIGVFSGHMDGDTDLLRRYDLTPMLNSPAQVARHLTGLPGHPFGVQLDTGMNRLGMEPADWTDLRDRILEHGPRLLMSHLACADEPDHPMNAHQLAVFRDMTNGTGVARSLAATGGILLGPDYHFDLTRPGVGLYGGLPFSDSEPVARLDVPVIQVRDVKTGETVGYGNAWTATKPARIATISAGYADGIFRAAGDRIPVFADTAPCPLRGRISMDLITADVTGLDHDPDVLTLLGQANTVDTLADAAGTIGYEILTALGARYERTYLE